MAEVNATLLIRAMLAEYDRRFLRKWGYRYWLVVVDNHFEQIHSIFLYTRPGKGRLVKSYELTHFPKDPTLYAAVMAALTAHSKLSITYRSTEHLVHPGSDVVQDTVHGHGHREQAAAPWRPRRFTQDAPAAKNTQSDAP